LVVVAGAVTTIQLILTSPSNWLRIEAIVCSIDTFCVPKPGVSTRTKLQEPIIWLVSKNCVSVVVPLALSLPISSISARSMSSSARTSSIKALRSVLLPSAVTPTTSVMKSGEAMSKVWHRANRASYTRLSSATRYLPSEILPIIQEIRFRPEESTTIPHTLKT
jgi:hypothetical protein